MKLHTTFRELQEAGACKSRYRHLAKALGGVSKYGVDTPITALQIYDIHGFNDLVWVNFHIFFNRALGVLLHSYDYCPDGRWCPRPSCDNCYLFREELIAFLEKHETTVDK